MLPSSMQMGYACGVMFKFSHTSGNFHYYSDTNGQWYAHNDAGQWYFQNAKGQFEVWKVNEVPATDATPADIINEEAPEENPDEPEVIEMEICDEEPESALPAGIDPKILLLPPPPPPPDDEAGVPPDQSATAAQINGKSDTYAQQEQLYGQYNFSAHPTYTGATQGPVFTNAGWIVSGGRRTKVRPEDIDLPAGPPPQLSDAQAAAAPSTGASYYYANANSANAGGQEHVNKSATVRKIVSRQLKQFAMLKKVKEDGPPEQSQRTLCETPSAFKEFSPSPEHSNASGDEEQVRTKPGSPESKVSACGDHSDSGSSSDEEKRGGESSKATESGQDPASGYQPVFCMYTETELAWPLSHVKMTKVKPQISYSYFLPNKFRHLLATHNQARKKAQRDWENNRRRTRRWRLRSPSPSSVSSHSASSSSGSDTSQRPQKRRSRSKSSRSSSVSSTNTTTKSVGKSEKAKSPAAKSSSDDQSSD